MIGLLNSVSIEDWDLEVLFEGLKREGLTSFEVEVDSFDRTILVNKKWRLPGLGDGHSAEVFLGLVSRAEGCVKTEDRGGILFAFTDKESMVIPDVVWEWIQLLMSKKL